MAAAPVSRQLPELYLDRNAELKFVQNLITLGEKPASTVRLFDFSNCYSVYGEDDCGLVAKIVYKSSAYVRYMLPAEKELSIPYVTLSKLNFEVLIRELLLVRNFRVEVYVRQATDSGNNDWKVEYRGSPGNLLQFEDILFSNKEQFVSSVVISLQLRMKEGGAVRQLGIATIEQNDYLFQVLEFIDDDFFSELEATIALLGPRECLIPATNGEYAIVKNLLERNNVMVTVFNNSNSIKKNELVEDLNRLVRFAKGQREDASALPEMKLSLAKEALQAAIIYLDLVNDIGSRGQFNIKQLNLERFVHLDSAAIAAINILPKPGTNSALASYRWQSILGVLDHCRTPQGHRMMFQWVKQPLRSHEILNDRHDIVQSFLEDVDTLNTLHSDFLKRLPDILLLTKKLLRHKAVLQDLFRIYQAIQRAQQIVNILSNLNNPTVNKVLCNLLQIYLNDLCGLKQMVEKVLDFKAIECGEYLIKASFDVHLEEMKDNMSELLEKMNRLQKNVSTDLELDRNYHVRLENVAHLGYHFRITLKDDSKLRKCKKYRILDVIKGGIRFTSTQLSELSDDFILLRKQYEEQQKTIVEEIIKVAMGYSAPLISLNSELAKLDCLVSFAVAAQSAPTPYVRPKILPEGSGDLILRNVRHPCLEQQENISYIPNDAEFRKSTCNMYIITGPNMGGKSTFIRSVGAVVLMAHVGSFVSCSEATISMVDSILGRVGSSDNISKNLSTFMVEMVECSGIIRTATEKSLVIIDELGRGTSTYEGCGIAWSIAEYLAKTIKCFALFATHFCEITNLADTVNTVKNHHMAASLCDDNFTLLYQVCPGVTTRSFGIQIARLADFPDSVVKRAENIYQEFDDEDDATQKGNTDVLDKIYSAVDRFWETTSTEMTEKSIAKLLDQFTKDTYQ